MKKYFHFAKRTFWPFLGLGILVFIVNFFIQSYWLKISEFVLNNPNSGYDFQLAILNYITPFLTYSPWVVLVIIFIIDILKRNFARSISFLFGLALVYGYIIGYILLGPAVSDYTHRTQFDSVSWKNEELVNSWKNPVRLRMVDDLLKKHELVGMSRNQIDELLGIPKATDHPIGIGYDYVYWLGPERGFISIDSGWLGIKFKENIVIDARILRD